MQKISEETLPSALLEVLDMEQNSTFTDHYIDMPFDLSNVIFITTANDANTIPAPLFDRMDVISLSSYTHEEKFHIATKHLIPKQLEKHGIAAKQLKITPAAVPYHYRQLYERGRGTWSGTQNCRYLQKVCQKRRRASG